MSIHEPVLLKEVISYLNPQPNQNFIDCTFGGGGHALEILERIKPEGKLIGIDWDVSAVQDSNNRNLILVNDNYKNLSKIIKRLRDVHPLIAINGILLDLGLSSDQLGAGDRGFSFQGDGFLDLRFDPSSNDLTAAEILKSASEEELIEIFKNYGDEPLAKPIARKIIALRKEGQKIETADVLVQLVSSIYHRYFKKPSRHNPATRIFQALRIAVNDEFNNIKTVLPQAIDLLSPGGRLAVIAFHSGEDRIVKNFFRDEAKRDNPKIKLITKKPTAADSEEVKNNPRSRSARLRVVERIF